MTELSPFFSLRILIILSAISFTGFFFLVSHLANVGFAENAADSVNLQNQARPLNNLQEETPHLLVGSFYTVEYGTEAKLLLNNKGIVPLEVRPTLYNLAGQSIEIAPVFVEPRSFRFINLQDWAKVFVPAASGFFTPEKTLFSERRFT